jgi:E3 ubiquitin-protein ligase TRIP12
MISSGTTTLFLRALSTAAKNSPKIALTLLEGGIAGTVYTILTGVLPPNDLARLEGEQGGGEGGQGIGIGLADMAVMQNLAGRPKEMVEEALSLVCELMPPLPRGGCLVVFVLVGAENFPLFLDGIFDPRGYTEKSVSRAIKSRMKDAEGRSGTSAVGNTNGTLGDSNAVASSSNPVAPSSNIEGEADGDTDVDGSSEARPRRFRTTLHALLNLSNNSPARCRVRWALNIVLSLHPPHRL